MKKKKSGMKKKVVGGLAAAVVAVLLLLSGQGLGLGGGGTGIGILGTQQESQGETMQQEEVQKEAVQEQETKESQAVEENTQKEELSKVVIITIKENQVFAGEKEFYTAEDLKAYIEEIHTDEREFKLKDEHSILETYEWVTKVFDDLKIQLIPVED